MKGDLDWVIAAYHHDKFEWVFVDPVRELIFLRHLEDYMTMKEREVEEKRTVILHSILLKP